MRFHDMPDEDTDILGCSLILKSGAPCGSNESVLHDFLRPPARGRGSYIALK